MCRRCRNAAYSKDEYAAARHALILTAEAFSRDRDDRRPYNTDALTSVEIYFAVAAQAETAVSETDAFIARVREQVRRDAW